ncbi:hypothetical protein AB6A40_010101 [Gnathostoma spinigerum]|uniref:Secreted protein n=1 Tax=Gnathostoma spinigerum TaxID=75299 RepID=A0ABD6F236_9BILA
MKLAESTKIWLFPTVCLAVTFADDKQRQVCWNGMQGVINGQVGKKEIEARYCKNPNAMCVSMTYCAISKASPTEYEYGYTNYCQGEAIATLPPFLMQDCGITGNGSHIIQKVCNTLQTADFGDNNIFYRMCCEKCSTRRACNDRALKLESPCQGREWSKVPMSSHTTTTKSKVITSTKSGAEQGHCSYVVLAVLAFSVTFTLLQQNQEIRRSCSMFF